MNTKGKVVFFLLGLGLSSLAFGDDASGPPEMDDYMAVPTPLMGKIERNQGVYIGLGLGFGHADEGDGLEDLADAVAAAGKAAGLDTNTNKTKGYFGARLNMGWDYNRYLGLDSGFSYYLKNDYKVHYSGKGSPPDYKSSMQAFTWDFLAKFTLPIQKWDLFAKAGGALDIALFKIDNELGTSVVENETNAKLVLMYGLGVGYNFNRNVAMNLQWLATPGSNKFDGPGDELSKAAPSTNLVVLGLQYKFAWEAS